VANARARVDLPSHFNETRARRVVRWFPFERYQTARFARSVPGQIGFHLTGEFDVRRRLAALARRALDVVWHTLRGRIVIRLAGHLELAVRQHGFAASEARARREGGDE